MADVVEENDVVGPLCFNSYLWKNVFSIGDDFCLGVIACYVFEYADMFKLSVLKPSEAFLCDGWISYPQMYF